MESGWGGHQQKRKIDIIIICLRKFSSSSWFGGSPCSYDLNRPSIFVGFLKGLLGNPPTAITFLSSPLYLKRLFLALEKCVAHLSIFRVRRGNLLCPLNNRGVSLAHDTKQPLFYCVARPLSEEGPSQWGSECLWERGLG